MPIKVTHFMAIDLVFKNNTSHKKFSRNFFIKILKTATETLKINQKIELSINLVTPARIKSLNKKYRGKDNVTDVLSFPLGDDSSGSYGILSLGDIFICPSFVLENADKNPPTGGVKRQMAWSAIHGFLHLLGYDHEKSKKEAQKMSRIEQKILKNLKLD